MWHLLNSCFAQILFVRPCVVMTHNNLCGLITVPTLLASASLLYFAPSFTHCQRVSILSHDRPTYTRGCPWRLHRCRVVRQGRRAKHGSHNNQPAPLLFSHLTFIHHPSFLLSLPDSALIEIYYPNEPPALVSDRPYVMFTRDGHANHSRLQTARYIADEYASSRLLVVVLRMMRKTIDWWGFEAACGRSVGVWVGVPQLRFPSLLLVFLPPGSTSPPHSSV